MSKQKIDEHGLIDLTTWHELYRHAKDDHSWYSSFSKNILKFLIEVYKPQTSKKLLMVCGDKTRLPLLKTLILRLEEAGIVVEFHWLSSKEKLRSLDLKLREANDYFAVLECITPLGVKKLSIPQALWIKTLQDMKIDKIALDCPSGLNPDTGDLLGDDGLNVHYTLSSFYHLQGLWTGLSRAFVGRPILFSDSIPREHDVVFTARLMHEQQIQSWLPKRLAFVHKGCFKRVVVIAGDSEMFGASIMVAKAALVMGAGRVDVLLPAGTTPPYAEVPELIWHVLSTGFEIKEYIHDDDILVLGPGLGSNAWATAVWDVVRQVSNQVVLDASGLGFLALNPGQHQQWIITPHPGEAAILLSCRPQDIQKNRYMAIRRLQTIYGATTVLKGSGTLILGDHQVPYVCPLGHAGMATPGMGDVLSGLIAGLWAQGLTSHEASIVGVWVHAYAAELAARHSLNRIVIASEVLSQIQHGFGGQ